MPGREFGVGRSRSAAPPRARSGFPERWTPFLPHEQPTAPSQRNVSPGQELAGRGELTCREPLQGPTPSFFLQQPSRPAPRIATPSHSGNFCCCTRLVPRGRPTHMPPSAAVSQPCCCLHGDVARGTSLVLVGPLTHRLVCGGGRRWGSGTWGLQTPHAGRPSGPSPDTREALQGYGPRGHKERVYGLWSFN